MFNIQCSVAAPQLLYLQPDLYLLLIRTIQFSGRMSAGRPYGKVYTKQGN